MHYQFERNHGCRVSDSWTYRGVDTAVIENEQLRVVVLTGKGADIFQLVHKPTDVDFLWRSPWGVRDPSKFTSTTGSGVGVWLDHYEGGWQTVFPGGGYPSEYRGAEIGLHAEANTMPWDCAIVEDTPERVSIRFCVRTYRTPFFFEKTLTLRSGSPVLEIDEALTNEAEERMHCVWGQHIALGPPFLSGDCFIDLPGGRLLTHPVDWDAANRLKPGFDGPWPWAERKDGTRVDMRRITPKDERVHEMSYVTDMPDGWYAVTNGRTGVGLGVAFPQDLFRYLWYWQSLGGGYGYPWYGRTYNVGIEPFTSYTNEGLQQAVENGTALVLGPGERVEASLKAVAFTGSKGVERVNPDGSVVLRV